MPITDIQVQHVTVLLDAVSVLYPDGKIDALDGGFIFRQISQKTGAHEEDIWDIARRLGYWEHTPVTIDQVCSERHTPVKEAGRFAADPFAGI